MSLSLYLCCQLKSYNDAKKVRYMLDKILPGETKRFYDNFDAMIEQKREDLRKTQADDVARLDEILKTLEWKDIRRREGERAVFEQRFKNHTKDMAHAYVMETRLRPEMSVKPSALWAKRKGYDATAAAMRGRQLLGIARGNKEGASVSTVLADTLVDKHDFRNTLQDTVVWRGSS
jgi:hypothetical protein